MAALAVLLEDWHDIFRVRWSVHVPHLRKYRRTGTCSDTKCQNGSEHFLPQMVRWLEKEFPDHTKEQD